MRLLSACQLPEKPWPQQKPHAKRRRRKDKLKLLPTQRLQQNHPERSIKIKEEMVKVENSVLEGQITSLGANSLFQTHQKSSLTIVTLTKSKRSFKSPTRTRKLVRRLETTSVMRTPSICFSTMSLRIRSRVIKQRKSPLKTVQTSLCLVAQWMPTNQTHMEANTVISQFTRFAHQFCSPNKVQSDHSSTKRSTTISARPSSSCSNSTMKGM